MAHRARLELRALVMHRAIGRGRCVPVSGTRIRRQPRRVALQAKNVYLVHLEQTGVDGTMGLMTCLAAFGLYGNMFENEWPLQTAVTLEADRVLGDIGA